MYGFYNNSLKKYKHKKIRNKLLAYIAFNFSNAILFFLLCNFVLTIAHAGVGPLPPDSKNVWKHAPYSFGDCSLCHKKNDKNNPGPVKILGNELCFTCHDQMRENIKKHKFIHAPANYGCIICHNPHNAPQEKLLHKPVPDLCLLCHTQISEITRTAKVKHDALKLDKKCLNCHNPHATNVQKMLRKLPFDLCISCHGTDEIKDHDDKQLLNFKKHLTENKVWHGPVKAKDCTACHKPHGSDNFRILMKNYPRKFYASYDPANYALCFNCHNQQILLVPRTTTLTNFRNGDKNLHYVHVHKKERGRTCRACHDIHASKKPHQIREGVPYGNSGWVLKTNYQELPTGGQCEKTCHSARSYNNTVATEQEAKNRALTNIGK